MTVAAPHEVDLLATPPPAESVLFKDATPCMAFLSIFLVLYYAVRPHDVVGDSLVVLSAGILALCIVSTSIRSVPTVTAIRQLVARESGVPEDITQGDILKRAAQGRTFAKILAVAWCESRKDEKQ